MPEEIVSIYKQQEPSLTTAEICRQYEISCRTQNCGKAKYAGIGTSEAKRLKRLEIQNRRLKRMFADRTLDMRAMKSINEGSADGHGEACKVKLRMVVRGDRRFTEPNPYGIRRSRIWLAHK